MNSDKLALALQQAQAKWRAGDTAGARRALEKLAAKYPASVDTRFMLGQVLGESGRPHDAARQFAHVAALAPNLPPAHYNWGLALRQQGSTEAAVQAFQRAASLAPDYLAAWYNLGSALIELERFADAEQALLHLLPADPSAEVYMALGVAAQGGFAFARAADYYLASIERGNRSYSGYLNLGTTYFSLNDYPRALEHVRQALALRPGDSVATHNAALCHLEMGEVAEAIALFRRSGYPHDQSAYLYALNFLPDYDPVAVFEAHRQWGEQAMAGASAAPLPARDLSPERPLRIGYLSADFRLHPVTFFLEQILARHDKSRFDIVCYSDVALADAVTERIKAYASQWRDVHGLTDSELAQRIRADGIDILVDLGGHTGERAQLFAARQAPVQVNFLGYANTSGLTTMDYRLTDELLDPPGLSERYHSEQLLRLGPNFYSYTPPAVEVAVGSLPALRSGNLTLASFNRIQKLNPPTLRLWATALNAVADARLIMVAKGIDAQAVSERLLAEFKQFGINSERIELIGHLSLADYLALHNRVDIALDCFPWNGHTTSMHALWMGVPTLTIAGKHHAGRFGCAIMQNVGLPEFIAQNEAQFVQRLAELAQRPEWLSAIRASLRERLLTSVLCDHTRLVGAIEASYRQMWRLWLAARNDV